MYLYQKGDYEFMRKDAFEFAKEKYFNGYPDTRSVQVRVTKRVKKIMLNTTSIRRMRVVFNLIFFTSFVTYL